MVENQEMSVVSLTASCGVAIWFSIQLWSLAILQNRVRVFFSIHAPTGSIPRRAREAVSGARIGKPCYCFKSRLWNASSCCRSFFHRLCTSKPYTNLGTTYFLHMSALMHCVSPGFPWKPGPISEYAVLLPRWTFSSVLG